MFIKVKLLVAETHLHNICYLMISDNNIFHSKSLRRPIQRDDCVQDRVSVIYLYEGGKY